jgi:hypothetical protein
MFKAGGPKGRSAVDKNGPSRLLQLAFVERDENAVSSLLKGGPARGDRILRGIALNQRPAAARLNGPQLVFSGSSLLDHSQSYGSALGVRTSTTEVLLVLPVSCMRCRAPSIAQRVSARTCARVAPVPISMLVVVPLRVEGWLQAAAARDAGLGRRNHFRAPRWLPEFGWPSGSFAGSTSNEP